MKKTKLFREELANKYASKKLEKPEDACWPIDEYINFYKQNKVLLHSLLLDINEYFVDHKQEYYIARGEKYTLTKRQSECISNITDIFTREVYGQSSFVEGFSLAYSELIDFIYYPKTKLEELTLNEIEIIKMMIAYLINKADQCISCLENHPDEYLGKYSIQKYKETIFRKYYNLVVDNVVVGNGWITKQKHYLRINGMHIYIKPEFRRKKYATKFYRLLGCEMTKMNIEWAFYVVDKTNEEAIGFLNQILNKYDNRYNRKNKIIFEDVFIVY